MPKIPFEVVFHPSWWNKNYGITFNEDYFFDNETRLLVEQKHRRLLFERFGNIGLGEVHAEKRPVIGPVHLAAGFIVPALLGCELRFKDDNPPEVICRNMTEEEVSRLTVPDIENTYPMNRLLSMMDSFEKQYGYVEGDINWSGLLNTALDLRGQNLLMDYYNNPELVHQLLKVIQETTIETVQLIRKRSNTSSVSVNRIVSVTEPEVYLHSNCSVTMISSDIYREFHLSGELALSEQLRPYGIHHCGNDMHRFAEVYGETGAVLYDVGWGSDIAFCREKLPDAILSLRVDPVQMGTWTSREVDYEVRRLIDAAGSETKIAVCCINMDDQVPDENIIQLFETVRSYG